MEGDALNLIELAELVNNDKLICFTLGYKFRCFLDILLGKLNDGLDRHAAWSSGIRLW
jgi:hypothetical protein